MKPLIAVPIGDPAGIGPVIVVKSIANQEVFLGARGVIIGDKEIMDDAIKFTNTTKNKHYQQAKEGVFEEMY